MKRFVLIMLSIFTCAIAYAATETINWYMDGNTYATTTCQTGGDIILPTTPTKYGYTFNGWQAYTPIEYLESTGTQIIDTGIYAESTYLRIKGKLRWTTGRTQNSDGFGSFNGAEVSITLYRTSTNSSCLETGRSLDSRGGNVPTLQDVDYEFDISANNGVRTGFWGDKVISQNYSSPLCSNQSFAIFGFKKQNTYYPSEPLRIYDFQIFSSSGIVRDFIPVLDKDGVPCMFDKVEHKFYYNAGTGQFIAGPIVGSGE